MPSRERVPESTLAGFLVVDGSGAGRFEGATELDAFGIIVAGAKEEEPVLRGQGAVLTGIPTSPTPPAEAPPGEAAPPASAPESPAPEAPEDREPAYPG